MIETAFFISSAIFSNSDVSLELFRPLPYLAESYRINKLILTERHD